MNGRVLAVVVLSACGGTPPPATSPSRASSPQRARTSEIELAIPAGYTDISASMKQAIPDVSVGLSGPRDAVIVAQRSSGRGGALDDAGCAERGKYLVEGGPQIPGKPVTLRGTAVVAWSGGKGCELDYLTPDGIPTRLFELYPAGTPPTSDTPVEIWTLTCQHEDGDQTALATCRETVATFVLSAP
jgi:hypothetical protein